MITVLEKGTKPKKKPPLYVRKCSNCSCKFTYNYNNLEYSYIFESRYIKCPQCDSCIFITINRKYRTKRFPFIGRKKVEDK